MEMLTMLISMKVKEGESEVEGANNTCRVTNDFMNDWMESNMVQEILNEKNEAMNRNQNWAVGENIIGSKNIAIGIAEDGAALN